ncbi:MAG: flagellar hook-basal body complex protein FliE [Planctomycetota bacterium]
MSFDYNAAASRIAGEFHKIGASEAAPKAAEPKEGFGDMLKGMISDTEGMQKEADQAVHQLMTGEKQNVHEVMLSMAKADVSFRMMLEVRNKLVEAYQEVMRMQV